MSRAVLAPDELVEDLTWLLDVAGETHIETIAKRVGYSPGALDRRLERLGRADLLHRMTGRGQGPSRAEPRAA